MRAAGEPAAGASWASDSAVLQPSDRPRGATTRPAPPFTPRVSGGVRVRADAQTDMPLAEASGAICVQRFDDSRTVQVTLRIAFRCVLHRCESQDIRC